MQHRLCTCGQNRKRLLPTKAHSLNNKFYVKTYRKMGGLHSHSAIVYKTLDDREARMAYRFKDRTKDEPGSLMSDQESAKRALEDFLQLCKDRGYTIEEHHEIGDKFPSFLVHKVDGGLVGDLTISIE